MGDKRLPDSVIVLKNILGEIGVKKYEPRVLYTIHTFMQIHAGKLIKNAQRLSISAGKSVIDLDDMILTLERSNKEMQTVPKRDLVGAMAEQLNNMSLPSNQNMNGIRLPQPKKIKVNRSVDSKLKFTDLSKEI